jgi:CheY-like chemotaxis protein
MTEVLIVDDDPDFVEITSMILKQHGYTVSTAASGDEALEKMRAERPDVLLLDVMMSTVLDGVNVSFAMSEDAELKSVPIVMISSIPDSPNADKFPTDEYVPISAWITKPVNPDKLVSTVQRLTG